MNYESLSEIDYFEYVQRCSERVQDIMGSGRIKTEEDLFYHMEQICMIRDPSEAFKAFSSISPYNWQDVVDKDLMEKYAYDLNSVAVHSYNAVVSNDVFENISDTCGYRFLTEGSLRKSFSLGNGSRVVFLEYWKAESSPYNLFYAIQLNRKDGFDLALFKHQDDSLVYIFEHEDLSLVWISEIIIPKPELELDYYTQCLSSELIKSGVPVELLHDIKIIPVDAFGETYKKDFIDPIDRFELHEYHFVLFYAEDGVLYHVRGFNAETEFESACSSVSDFIRNSQFKNVSSF